jgi:hypothetical protein
LVCSVCRIITGRDRLTWLDHIHHIHPSYFEQLLKEQRIKRARNRERHDQQTEECDEEQEQYLTPEEALDEGLKNINSEVI